LATLTEDFRFFLQKVEVFFQERLPEHLEYVGEMALRPNFLCKATCIALAAFGGGVVCLRLFAVVTQFKVLISYPPGYRLVEIDRMAQPQTVEEVSLQRGYHMFILERGGQRFSAVIYVETELDSSVTIEERDLHTIPVWRST